MNISKVPYKACQRIAKRKDDRRPTMDGSGQTTRSFLPPIPTGPVYLVCGGNKAVFNEDGKDVSPERSKKKIRKKHGKKKYDQTSGRENQQGTEKDFALPASELTSSFGAVHESNTGHRGRRCLIPSAPRTCHKENCPADVHESSGGSNGQAECEAMWQLTQPDSRARREGGCRDEKKSRRLTERLQRVARCDTTDPAAQERIKIRVMFKRLHSDDTDIHDQINDFMRHLH